MAGRTVLRFTPLRAREQAEAVRFLNEQRVRDAGLGVIKPDILRRIEPSGALDRIRTASSAC